MTIPEKYIHRSLYHLTHIDNIPSIIKFGLLSTNEIKRIEIVHTDVAYEDIQERRSIMRIPSGNGEVIHDYVPLYFSKRSPMLYAIIKNQRINERQIVYFEFPIQILEKYPSVYTDSSANTNVMPQFYTDTSDLKNIDWNAIDTWKWGHNYDLENITICQKKQAEVLIYRNLPLDLLEKVIVWDSNCKAFVEKVFKENNIHNVVVEIGQRDFYFTK